MNSPSEELEVSKLIKADRERVFAAWTDPAMIVQWWGAGGVTCGEAEMDLAVGGRYRIANDTPDGARMWITGIFSQLEPPSHLAYTWAMEPVGPESHHSLVEVDFTATADGTLVTVRQRRIESPEAREVHLQGWIGCLDGLSTLLT